MITTLTSQASCAADPDLQPLLDHVIAATGLVYYRDRCQEFARHVASRIDALRLSNCRSYHHRLEQGTEGEAELDRLIALLTIGETHFFRHRELFQALETTVLAHLIDKNRHRRRLRIWSAGCSIGAEAYSVSMLLRRRFATALTDWDVQIVGTDINREFLARASAGRYEQWALRAVPAEQRDALFVREGKTWAVKDEFRRGVSFEYHNLADPRFALSPRHAQAFDLILCRNVMIYFSEQVVRRAIDNLHACLSDGGWLVVGHAEHNVNWFRSFRTQMSDGAVLYQKPTSPRTAAEMGEAEHDSAAFASRTAQPTPAGDVPSAAVSAVSTIASPVAAPASPLPPATAAASEAAARFEPPPAAAPGDPLQEIRLLADRGELDEALRRCQALQQRDSRNPSPHLFQALILQQSDDDAGAELSLKRAIYLDRHHPLAHYYLGVLLQRQRQTARATRSFRNVAGLLAGRCPTELVPDADELTVADLQQLTATHLSVLEPK